MKVNLNPLAPYKGVLRRLFLLYRHVIGLLAGGFIAYVNSLPAYKKKWLRSGFRRFAALLLRPFVKKELRNQPFEIQLRRRLEILGPTYVKLGQIMAIREDILPPNITSELTRLLDQLPEVPFEAIREIVENDLNAPLKSLFLDFKKEPLGSASIGQTHRATTYHGKPVVVKVIKPGIRDAIMSDLKLLEILSSVLNWLIPQYQPKIIASEFCRYTEKEVDLTYEADHAELFAANFSDSDTIVFPKIFRDLSSENVLCMEFFDGIKPNDQAVFELGKDAQQKIIDTGLYAIIKMLYEDGFFHADLHAGNLIVMPGPVIGFIDLGMVGRFDEQIKKQMLYYFYALVNGDIEGSAKHLMSMARIGNGGDPAAFRRAVMDILRRYRLQAAHGNYSIAQLILNSLGIGSKYRIFFPVEMTLMVKSLVTFEGVGNLLDPNLDVPGLSRKHIQKIFFNRYQPDQLFQRTLRGLPELLDAVVQLPKLISDGSRSLDHVLNESNPENPLEGLRSGLMAGALLIGGVIALVQNANPFLWGGLFIGAAFFYLFGK